MEMVNLRPTEQWHTRNFLSCATGRDGIDTPTPTDLPPSRTVSGADPPRAATSPLSQTNGGSRVTRHCSEGWPIDGNGKSAPYRAVAHAQLPFVCHWARRNRYSHSNRSTTVSYSERGGSATRRDIPSKSNQWWIAGDATLLGRVADRWKW